MLLNRKQYGWVWTTLVLALIALAAYWFDPQAHDRGHRGSNWVGLALGAIALMVFLFCAALSFKRKVPHWRLGRSQNWLRGHVWLGLLSVWLVALHAGFGAGGPMTTCLWVLTGLVTVSALFGLVLQQFIPSLLLHSVPGETLAQQLNRLLGTVPASQLKKPGKDEIPGWPRTLQEQAFSAVLDFAGQAGTLDNPCPATESEPTPAPKPAAVAASPAPAAPTEAKVVSAASPVPVAAASEPKPASAPAVAAAAPASAPKPAVPPVKKIGPPQGAEPLRRFYLDYAQGFFEGKPSILGDGSRAESLFLALRTMSPAHIHPGIDALMYLTDRRRQLIRQRNLMRVLYSWLIIHVPLSWGLLILAIVHAFDALRYSPPPGL